MRNLKLTRTYFGSVFGLGVVGTGGDVNLSGLDQVLGTEIYKHTFQQQTSTLLFHAVKRSRLLKFGFTKKLDL